MTGLSLPFDLPVCKYCGGDDSSPNHWQVCDGKQGKIEAMHAPAPAAAPATTIKSPRDTSVQAFYNAVDAGIIETRRAQVWSALEKLGIATANEVFEHLKEERRLGLRYDSNTRARFTELRDLGLIREEGERACRVTGQTCIAWAVVPSDQYAGVAIIHRCQECGHIVSREVPTPEAPQHV